MRKVFSSQSQLCHVWANQSQSEGRANNMFFRDNLIYSYGYHYLAAQIHTVKGKSFALVRSDVYSPSTGRHLNYIDSSLCGLMPGFRVPGKAICNPKEASLCLDKDARDTIARAMKRIKVTNKESVNWELEFIDTAFKDANKLRAILGKKPIKPSKKDIQAVKDHFAYRFKRYQELNTPEHREKLERDKARREERKVELAAKKHAEQIEKFRRGEVHHIHELPYELLRVQGTEVVTSRGARVPLDAAVTLYRAIEAGKNVVGATIGHFTVNAIQEVVISQVNPNDPGTDKIITIGCHRILLSEARALLAMKVAA